MLLILSISFCRKSTFLSTYNHIILPCNGPKLWPVTNYDPINPPYMRRAPGRPKKARRKANDEPKNPHRFKRQQSTVRCTLCGSLGHNKRSCIGRQLLTGSSLREAIRWWSWLIKQILYSYVITNNCLNLFCRHTLRFNIPNRLQVKHSLGPLSRPVTRPVTRQLSSPLSRHSASHTTGQSAGNSAVHTTGHPIWRGHNWTKKKGKKEERASTSSHTRVY